MPSIHFNYGNWQFWSDYDPANGRWGNQKCTFDGSNKIIFVNEGVTEINIQQDVYSAWKEWSQYENNVQFDPAVRATGGDPLGNGQFAGDIYFLTNDWKLRIDVTKTTVDGTLFSDDFPTAYYDFSGTAIFPITVSNLVRVVETQASLDNAAIAAAVVAALDPSLTTINEGVKKASKLIPHSTDI